MIQQLAALFTLIPLIAVAAADPKLTQCQQQLARDDREIIMMVGIVNDKGDKINQLMRENADLKAKIEKAKPHSTEKTK